MPLLEVGPYNVGGDPSDAEVAADVARIPAKVKGLCEMGDRAGVERRLAAQGFTVLRKPTGGANRLALVLDGLAATDFDVFPLPGCGDKVEGTVAGNRDRTAECKFIAWAEIEATTIGVTHLIPSTARRTITGAWKHPLARDIYRRQVHGCAEWFRQGGDVLMGDFNGVPDYGLLAELREVAVCLSAPSHNGRAIDHVWVRKDSGVVSAYVKALVGYSSDHRPVVAGLVLPTLREPVPTPEERLATLLERIAAGEEVGPVVRPRVRALAQAQAGQLRGQS